MMKKSIRAFCSIAMSLPLMTSAALADGIVTELVENAAFELNATYSNFRYPLASSNTTLERNTNEIFSTLGLETEAVITDDDVYSWLNLELVAMYGTLHQVGQGVFRKPNASQSAAHFLDAKRVAYHAEIMDGDVELIMGKEFIEFGVAENYSPTDRFAMSVAVDPTEADAHGVWQAGFKVYSGDDHFEYRFIPLHERGASANGKNRWQGLIAQNGAPQVEPFQWRNVGNLISYNAVRQGYDWFVLAHHGQAAYPIVTRDPGGAVTDTFSVTPNAWSFGGGASAVKEEWKFVVETLVQITEHALDQDYLMYTIGFSYRETDWANEMGMEELTYYLEYGGEVVLDEQKIRPYISQNSYTYRQNQDTFLPKLEIKVDDTWSGTLSAAINARDNDYTYGMGVEYKDSDNLRVRASYTDFSGSTGTIYGNWERNDVLKLNVEYKF
ncbi:hypothetical protein V5T82_13805 [Magnetovibrio sp. PR-2]|uniref:outer membrane protein n=1 Tax=Magnetovibrio sp. PR-2 TaxID=3120356 RepID=UPI002FCDE229